MKQSNVTFFLNGNTYHLSATDTQAIKTISKGDRQQLLEILEAIKAVSVVSQSAISHGLQADKPQLRQGNAGLSSASSIDSQVSQKVDGFNTEKTSNVDALMAQLMVEDRTQRGEGLTKKGVYTFIGVFTAVVIILILVFGS